MTHIYHDEYANADHENDDFATRGFDVSEFKEVTIIVVISSTDWNGQTIDAYIEESGLDGFGASLEDYAQMHDNQVVEGDSDFTQWTANATQKKHLKNFGGFIRLNFDFSAGLGASPTVKVYVLGKE